MKFIKICLLLVVLISTGSCKKWLDVNEDPATPQVAKAEYLLPPIIFQMANNTANDYRVIFKYTQNMFSQNVAASSIEWDEHGYTVANDIGGSLWRMVYVNFGLNLEDMIKDAEANNKWTYAGIGYAIKAWGFQMLTDSHGPVILNDVFAKNKLSFTYSEQDEVYEQVRVWSYQALACFQKPDGADYSAVLSSVSGDTMYKGDREKWKKFIYGLLALQYSHLVNKPQFKTAYADSVVKYAKLSFEGAADDATIMFNGNNSSDSNPFSQNAGLITSAAYGRIGQPIVDLLTGGVRGVPALDPKTSIDPRLTRMINPIATGPAIGIGVYRGVMPTEGDDATTKTIPHVLGSVSGTAASPFPGKYLFADAARYPIMSYSQLQFALAEAYFHQGLTGPAHTAYINGIKGHMDFVNLYGRNGSPSATAISTTEVNNYLASSEVVQNHANLTLADIMGQKYIAQWGWAGMEQWTDLRKYHYDPLIFRQYKQLEPSQLFPSNAGKYAYRIRPRYHSEYDWNKDELERWGGLLPNYHTYEPWFNLSN